MVPFAVGIVIGKLLMLTAALAGLAALVHVLGPAFVVIRFAGAAYLLWLGVQRWRRAGQPLPDGAEARGMRRLVAVGGGLAVTLSNPVAILFYLALLPNVVDVARITLAGYAILCAVLVAVMAVIVSAVGVLAEMARRLLSVARSKSRVDRVAGALLIGAGILVAVR
jgi:threonine/homoserine/homoserine lactone efflux protein